MNNYFDLFFLVILGSGAIWGFKRGLIQGVLNLVAIGAAIWAGFQFSVFLEAFVRDSGVIPEELVSLAAMLLTGVLAYFGIKFAAGLISKLVRSVGLGLFDRIGGAALGIIINILVITAFLDYGLRFVPAESTQSLNESVMYPHLRELATTIKTNFHFLPDALKSELE